jgi:hypothetical protein
VRNGQEVPARGELIVIQIGSSRERAIRASPAISPGGMVARPSLAKERDRRLVALRRLVPLAERRVRVGADAAQRRLQVAVLQLLGEAHRAVDDSIEPAA